MNALVMRFTGSGFTPIDTTSVQLGQAARQARSYKVGIVCEINDYGYTLIFPDGSEAQHQQVDCLSPFTKMTLMPGRLASPAQVEALKAKRIQNRDAARLAQEAASKKHAEDYALATAELRTKYPWAIPADATYRGRQISGHARAAKNMRLELAKAFPGVKFSVKSECFSGGDSVDVDWTDGPTSREVENLTGKYSDGHFNGMIDCYEYDRSAYGNAVDAVLGRAKYIMEHRTVSIYDRVKADLIADYAELSDYDAQRQTHELLARTSLLNGFEYAGLHFNPINGHHEIIVRLPNVE